MSTLDKTTSPTRSDSKAGVSTKIEAQLETTPASKPRPAFFDVGSECRRQADSELVSKICVHDMREIRDAMHLRRATSDLPDDYQWTWLETTLQDELAIFLERGGMVCAKKAECALVNPDAASKIRNSLNKVSFLLVEADYSHICETVQLLLYLGLTRVALDLRQVDDHNVFSIRFLKTARKAGLKIESLVLFYRAIFGYSWVSSFQGHDELREFEETRLIWEAEDVDAMCRCGTGPSKAYWCEGQTRYAVDRREVIAKDGQISESFRSFLGQLQADDEDE